MRVCQPSPVARKAAKTSASKRSLTGSFVDADFGRPLFLSFVPSYKSAFLKNAGVNSGASSGSVQTAGIDGFFAFICFPHIATFFESLVSFFEIKLNFHLFIVPPIINLPAIPKCHPGLDQESTKPVGAEAPTYSSDLRGTLYRNCAVRRPFKSRIRSPPYSTRMS